MIDDRKEREREREIRDVCRQVKGDIVGNNLRSRQYCSRQCCSRQCCSRQSRDDDLRRAKSLRKTLVLAASRAPSDSPNPKFEIHDLIKYRRPLIYINRDD